MSKPSSPPNHRHPADENSSEPAAQPTSRRLLSPAERFASPQFAPLQEVVQATELQDVELGERLHDPFVAEPTSLRLEDEMARRHLPPRERQKHERLMKKRQKKQQQLRSTRYAAGYESRHPHSPDHDSCQMEVHKEAQRNQEQRGHEYRNHEKRAQAEREFAQQARNEPPKAKIRKRRRVPVWIKRVCLLIVLLFIGQLGFAVLNAPQFEIQTVSIAGNKVTPREELRALASRLRGQNLIRVNHKAVEKAVEALPTVARASVIRLPVWPPKVELHIEEREPVLQVGSGSNWWVIDATGMPFRLAEPTDSHLYQVVAPEFSPKRGQKLDAVAWRRAATLNEALRRDNLRVNQERVGRERGGQERGGQEEENSDSGGDDQNRFWQLRRIYFDKDGLASLRLTGRGALAGHNEMLVRLGDDRWDEKLERARVTLSYFEKTGRKAQELDLVSLERPVWMPVPAQLAAEGDGENGEEHTG